MDMGIAEVLQGVRELLSDPARRTARAFARDKHGKETRAEAEDAVCWCAVGAIRKVAGDYLLADEVIIWLGERFVSYVGAEEDLLCQGNTGRFVRWHDKATQEELLDFLDRAIVAAKKEDVLRRVPAHRRGRPRRRGKS